MSKSDPLLAWPKLIHAPATLIDSPNKRGVCSPTKLADQLQLTVVYRLSNTCRQARSREINLTPHPPHVGAIRAALADTHEESLQVYWRPNRSRWRLEKRRIRKPKSRRPPRNQDECVQPPHPTKIDWAGAKTETASPASREQMPLVGSP